LVYLCGVSNGSWGLHIIDVSDPANPKIISQRSCLETAPSEYRLTQRGKYLYIGTRHDLGFLMSPIPQNPRDNSPDRQRESDWTGDGGDYLCQTGTKSGS